MMRHHLEGIQQSPQSEGKLLAGMLHVKVSHFKILEDQQSIVAIVELSFASPRVVEDRKEFFAWAPTRTARVLAVHQPHGMIGNIEPMQAIRLGVVILRAVISVLSPRAVTKVTTNILRARTQELLHCGNLCIQLLA